MGADYNDDGGDNGDQDDDVGGVNGVGDNPLDMEKDFWILSFSTFSMHLLIDGCNDHCGTGSLETFSQINDRNVNCQRMS